MGGANRKRRCHRLVPPLLAIAVCSELWKSVSLHNADKFLDTITQKQQHQEFKEEEEEATGYAPHFFSNFPNCVNRDFNFINPLSGCRIAAWVYNEGTARQFLDCEGTERKLDDPSMLQPWDTVYVPYKSLGDFAKKVLKNVKVPFVLLSGQFHFAGKNLIPQTLTANLIDNPFIVHWFGQNINVHNHLMGVQNWTQKLSPLPFGLQPINYQPPILPGPMETYKRVLQRHLTLPQKSIDIFEPYLNIWTNEQRRSMPSGPALPLEEYLELVAKSRYVLVPDGDRPECYRHYEALGLGAIPITELNPLYHGHLAQGPILYNNTKWWNLTHPEILEALKLDKFPVVNRNMVFEEYWMEYMEGVVGRPLRWFDHRQDARSYLLNFTLNAMDYVNNLSLVLCGECIWARAISCQQRIHFLKEQYGTPYEDAIRLVLKVPSCRKPQYKNVTVS